MTKTIKGHHVCSCITSDKASGSVCALLQKCSMTQMLTKSMHTRCSLLKGIYTSEITCVTTGGGGGGGGGGGLLEGGALLGTCD